MLNLEEVLEKTQLFDMLQFETQLFLDILHEDGLVVAAKGLSTDVVLLNIFKVYCDPGNLIIVLNSTEAEEKYFIERLNDENVHSTTFSTNTTDREDVYLSGGIQFVTTRILVVDMLKRRVPIENITGIIVLRAHTVLESCQEAFVLRLYRQENKTGFIKAFSNSVQSFTFGFGHIERIMRTLFVKELYIWPRFHSTVIQSLKDYEPEVVELHIPLSNTMLKIQTCILDLINLTIKELKRINKTLEVQEVTVENCLTKQFHKILQNQLDCVWHQLSSKSKQLVADLKTLRHLIITMLYTDPVTFYSILSEYRTMKYAQTSTWVLLQPAEQLFTLSSLLIYRDKEFNPEQCPKWQALTEILKVEITTEMKTKNVNDNNIVILCQDTRTCFQLNQFLTQGPHHYLFLIALKYGIQIKTINERFKSCRNLQEQCKQSEKDTKKNNDLNIPAKRSKLEQVNNVETSSSNLNDITEDLENLKSLYCLTMSQSICNTTNSNDDIDEQRNEEYIFEPFLEMENMNLTQLSVTTSCAKPTILIRTFKMTENCESLTKTLEDIKPNYIIMYHSDVTAVRQIELYNARRKSNNKLKVFFLIHAETVEEQSYLTTLRREKDSFEYLIETKSTMVVPKEQDGKSDHCVLLQREKRSQLISTRHGGQKSCDNEREIIIVDMREFRSELPALIHKRGIDIEPLTITVGDYILTSDICIERKSLSDLIGSLNSGRLYQQCTQMSRYYAKPMLLIEFDQNRQFSWQSNYMVSNDNNNFDVQQKLLLLTIHFPKLKIIWSPSPYASAQLFEELKDGKDQPNTEYTAAVGLENDVDVIESKYNSNVYDFVQKLPGITSKNIDIFLRKTKNMDNVLTKTVDELKEILGNNLNSRDLHSILHEEHAPKDTNLNSKHRGKIKNKLKCSIKKA